MAWEVTRKCNLNCIHCRSSSEHGPYDGELNTTKCFEILKQINLVASPIIILTGGEPLLREDIFDISDQGTKMGLRMVLATNGTLLTTHIIERIKASGIKGSVFPLMERMRNSMMSLEMYQEPIKGQ